MSDHLMTRVINVIATTQHIPVESITADSTFEELKIDSLDGINILVCFRERIQHQHPRRREARGIRTVREMAAGVEKLTASA